MGVQTSARSAVRPSVTKISHGAPCLKPHVALTIACTCATHLTSPLRVCAPFAPITRFHADFEDAPMKLQVKVAGTVHELCPGQAQFGTHLPTCEFALHGRQSLAQCCPHGISMPKGTFSA